jgi:dTMP kinase
MKKSRGLFIVLEGLDGAGTTTQAKQLHKALLENNLKSCLTNEPTDEPVGKLIRDSLSGRLTSPTNGERIRFSEAALGLLFAADRIEHSCWIEKIISKGTHVVCDRYIWSSIAYQSLDPTVSPERVVEINRGCAVPDVTFLIEVPVKECIRRLKARNDAPTVYEKKSILEGIHTNYRSTRRLYEKTFGTLIVLDGTAPVGEVHSEIVEGIRGLLGF